jgi:hypothetical protein
MSVGQYHCCWGNCEGETSPDFIQGDDVIFLAKGILGHLGSSLLAGVVKGVTKTEATAVAKKVGTEVVEKAVNRAEFELYKDGLRAAMEKPHVTDSTLGKLLSELYRPGAKVGSGSTAAAVRAEAATGEAVGGRLHAQKARDAITALQKWLAKNPTASPGDRAAAENVILDMLNALGGN